MQEQNGRSVGTKLVRIVAVFLCLIATNVFLSLNRHSHGPKFNYHSELWADQAGYFVYLPAAVSHDCEADRFPPHIDSLTGWGFRLDTVKNVVLTKYTYGVALLQSPVYFIGHMIRWARGVGPASFDAIDHVVVDVSASIYLSLGLLLLWTFLRERTRLAAWIVLVIYIGTNLFYYAVFDPGMSHVYSFFLYSATLCQLSRLGDGTRPVSRWQVFLLAATLAMVILVRPINAIFILCMLIAFPTAVRRVSAHTRTTPTASLVAAAVPILLVWIPQLLYWKYAFGKYLHWSYEGEGFSHLADPAIARYLFSTNNGLIPYAPIILLAIPGCFLLWKRGERSYAIASLLALVLVGYSTSAWWLWNMGCGFGSRSMVEYFALLALPIDAFAAWFLRTTSRSWLLALLMLLVAYELKLVYSYGDCWFGGDWDWNAFEGLVFGPTK